ncbi:hypothetical protein ACIRU8_45390 [Streptomyces sp. NPDC101175]|uniref:hypothetical protein n=1 Tax=Streptomyces sp. NPDC101175 TaxID=3366123 RepID=UPI003837C69E
MELSTDARTLLGHVAKAGQPVAMSDFFHTIHPPAFDRSAPDDDPARESWTQLQLGLYRASIDLHEEGLVHVVHPATGERPDLVVVTDAGRATLV